MCHGVRKLGLLVIVIGAAIAVGGAVTWAAGADDGARHRVREGMPRAPVRFARQGTEPMPMIPPMPKDPDSAGLSMGSSDGVRISSPERPAAGLAGVSTAWSGSFGSVSSQQAAQRSLKSTIRRLG